MRTSGSVSTMNAIGLPTTCRPSDSVPRRPVVALDRPDLPGRPPRRRCPTWSPRPGRAIRRRRSASRAPRRRRRPGRRCASRSTRCRRVVERRVADEDHVGRRKVVGRAGRHRVLREEWVDQDAVRRADDLEAGCPVVGESRAHSSPRIDSQPLTNCTNAWFSGTAIPLLVGGAYDGTVDHVDLRLLAPPRSPGASTPSTAPPSRAARGSRRCAPARRCRSPAHARRRPPHAPFRSTSSCTGACAVSAPAFIPGESGGRERRCVEDQLLPDLGPYRRRHARLESTVCERLREPGRPGRRRSAPPRTSPRSSAGRRDAPRGPAPVRRPRCT